VERIEAAKRYKHNANLQPRCHSCEFRMKKDLVHSCNVCATSLCYECIDFLTNHSLFEVNKYKCAICLGLCKCSKCLQSDVPAQPGRRNKKAEPSWEEAAECTRCEILNSQYDKIRIECTQCKIYKCYNCAKSENNVSIYLCSFQQPTPLPGFAQTATISTPKSSTRGTPSNLYRSSSTKMT